MVTAVRKARLLQSLRQCPPPLHLAHGRWRSHDRCRPLVDRPSRSSRSRNSRSNSSRSNSSCNSSINSNSSSVTPAPCSSLLVLAKSVPERLVVQLVVQWVVQWVGQLVVQLVVQWVVQLVVQLVVPVVVLEARLVRVARPRPLVHEVEDTPRQLLVQRRFPSPQQAQYRLIPSCRHVQSCHPVLAPWRGLSNHSNKPARHQQLHHRSSNNTNNSTCRGLLGLLLDQRSRPVVRHLALSAAAALVQQVWHHRQDQALAEARHQRGEHLCCRRHKRRQAVAVVP